MTHLSIKRFSELFKYVLNTNTYNLALKNLNTYSVLNKFEFAKPNEKSHSLNQQSKRIAKFERSFKTLPNFNKQMNSSPTSKRFIFRGTDAEPMFKFESNIQLPELNQGEVLVKVRASTICLSDIHTVCGKRIEPTPSILGHEACVEIVDHKRADSNLKIGDRVTFSIADSCGNCEFCLNDLSQKCTKLFKYGHAAMNNGTGFNGCYATHIILRKGTKIIKLPKEINDSLAATMNCSLATMVNCVSHIPNRIKQNSHKALIQGDGMLGIYGCALLKEYGFKEVYCSVHRPDRIELLKEFGAIPIFEESLLKSKLNQFDCIIEACGDSTVVANGIKLLKPGGIFIFTGMVHPQTAFTLTGEDIIRKCLTLIGVHNYQGKDLEESVRFLRDNINKYPFDKLISPTIFSLDNLPDAIEFAKQKTYPRVCVMP